jgi:hypothetical protein
MRKAAAGNPIQPKKPSSKPKLRIAAVTEELVRTKKLGED